MALIMAGGGAAQAACVLTGSDVVCTGDSAPFDGSALDNGTVTVAPGATVGDTGVAIEVHDNVIVVNDGDVTSTDDHAIKANDDLDLTNNGTITADKDGIHAGKDAVIVNNGHIDGGDEGIQVDAGSTVTNNGTIEGADRGIDGDETGVTVVNSGSITAGSDGIRVGKNGMVTNESDGYIYGGDDGVQIDDGSRVFNHGSIVAAGETINAGDTDDIEVVNSGLIQSNGDDGIDAGTNFRLWNTGEIIGTLNDGVELDSGEIVNFGRIVSLSSSPGETDSGIDFDAAGGTVTNSGYIEGDLAIGVDVANTATQTVINRGTLVGRNGTAVKLGDGADTFAVGTGSTVDGLIDLGDDLATDTFEVLGPVAGLYTFVSAPEEFLPHGYNAIVVGNRIALVDTSPFAAIDASFAELGMDLSQTLGTLPAGPGAYWMRSFGGWSQYDPAALTQGFDLLGGGVAIGRDWQGGDTVFGVFAGGAAYGASLGDDIHDTGVLAGFGGVRVARSASPDLTLNGAVWGGIGNARVDSPELASGDGSTSGLIAGVDAGFVFAPAGGPVSVEGNAGYNGFFGGSMGLSGLDTTVSDTGSHHLHASLEIGVPVTLGSATVTPFVRGEANKRFGDGRTATFSGSTISLAENDVATGANLLGGLKVSTGAQGGAMFDARIAAGAGADGRISVDGRLTLRFGF